MTDEAAFLTDCVIGDTPVRHWVLSLPPPLRYLPAYEPSLVSEVLAAFLSSVFRHLRRRAKKLFGLSSVLQAHPGSVTAIQRCSSHLALNLHFHSLVTDGVFVQLEGVAFTIDVRANTVPVARAGPDQVLEAGSFVVLDGSGTADAEGDPITYAWTRDSGPSTVTLANEDTPSPAFVAGQIGTYVLRLRATDDRFASSEDTVRVTATAPLPDLFVEAVQAPVTAIVGEDITLGTSVKNRGGATSTAPFVTEFFLSEDTTLDVLRDRRLGSAPPVQRMDPGARVNVGAPGLLVPLDLPPADYHVIARVDPTDTVLEGDETNNSPASTLPTSVAPMLSDDHPSFAAATDPASGVPSDGTLVAGILDRADDADVFRTDLGAGTLYLLETRVTGETDTVLTLLDTNGTTVLATSNDAASRDEAVEKGRPERGAAPHVELGPVLGDGPGTHPVPGPVRPNKAIRLVVLEPGPRHLQLQDRFFRALGVAANLTTAAHMAAIAAEHQGEVHSIDADFARFPRLRWRSPLSGARARTRASPSLPGECPTWRSQNQESRAKAPRRKGRKEEWRLRVGTTPETPRQGRHA